MDLDQSFLSELPLQHRQKVCKQIRQRQIEKYVAFETSERGQELEPRRQNKKKANVHFSTNLQLQTAVTDFDDRQVVKFLTSGGDANFSTGNGTALLHRCAAEDNVSSAELLITHGANVDITDDDWWTPLHTACSCDSVEMIQLLLNYGANVAAIDVDGYFAVDHTADGSEAKTIMTRHIEKYGMDLDSLHENRKIRPQEMLNHIKSLPLSVDINQFTEDGATLLHIASANGYRTCIKALLRYDPDINKLDCYGWTPLHVAARFNQMKACEMLLKKRANPNIEDMLGSKPSAVTSSDELRALLMRYEKKYVRDSQLATGKGGDNEAQAQAVYLQVTSSEEDLATSASMDSVYDEIDEYKVGGTQSHEDAGPQDGGASLFRINSKTVRTKQLTIAKEDGIQEAKRMYEAIADVTKDNDMPLPPPPPEFLEGWKEDEDEDIDDYISHAIWKSGAVEQGKLAICMDNDNLITLTSVREDAILKDLQRRYQAGQIYTYIGDVLIAVNPFQEMEYFAKDISMKYHSPETDVPLPPHIYGIAENSYRRLTSHGKCQCHVISGESGSGKTESCKYIVQHLLRVAGSEETNLNSKINQMNPLLEAFGNAVTVMNNNSSRFGKFVELNFSPDGKVVGASISEYMLEKSRIVHQGKGECNFHIFYWMMAGLSPEEVKVYQLENMHKFRYLSGTAGQSTSENKAKYWEVKECLQYIGFSSTDIQNMLQTLSTVLHLGELTFQGVGNNEAAIVKNTDMLKKVSQMLEVSEKELGSALVADYTMTRGEQIKKERTVEQAGDCRDALAKTLYARLFSWIVNGINQLIQPANQGKELQIGILDIFGFENFSKNSFEQICINVANEQIQVYTNENIFHSEQQDCLLEGVPGTDIDYTSNQAILDLFLERPTGLLSILDEESNFPRATDKSLAIKLHQNTGKKHNRYYKTPRDSGLCFTVVHYAGSVTYDVSGILEKNRDTLPNSILYTMKTSNRLLIKELFQSRVTRTGSLAPSARQQRSRRTTMKKQSSPFEFFKKFKGNKADGKNKRNMTSVEKKGPSTMAYHFRNSLADLINKLQSSEPHFVRCVKPNVDKAAMVFVTDYVLAQLRYTGISEIVKIRKYGYALRVTFHEFLIRYPALVACCLPQFCPMPDRQKCECIVQQLQLQGVQYGKSKVFFKMDHVDRLEHLTIELQGKVTKAQSVVRGFLDRKKTKRLSDARNQERQHTLKKKEVENIAQSLETLDDVIGEYEMAFTYPDRHKGQTDAQQDHPDDIYDDAFSPRLAEDDIYDDAFSPRLAEGDVREGDAMNGHVQRALPQTPAQHALQYDASRPPPSPREMYSQGMYASIEDQYHDHRRQAPPPPKRNPDTRLSTSSVGSYDEIHETSPHHPPHHQKHPQQHHHQQTQQQQFHHPHDHAQYSPQRGNQSPKLPGRNVAGSGSSPVQSPTHNTQRPFSYGAHVVSQSPKLQHHHAGNERSDLGHGQHNQQHVPNYSHNGHNGAQAGHGVHGAQMPQSPTMGHKFNQYEGQNMGRQSPVNPAVSPATQYGKHESVFHPQPHHPPPHQAPPPPPQGQGHMPHQGQMMHQGQPGQGQGHTVTAPHPQHNGSPRQMRHASPVSPAHPQDNHRRTSAAPPIPRSPRISQRSKSVPCHPDDVSPMGTLPQPPPPLSSRDNYLSAALQSNRPPSPPLPPPPPELMDDHSAPPMPPRTHTSQQPQGHMPNQQHANSRHPVQGPASSNSSPTVHGGSPHHHHHNQQTTAYNQQQQHQPSNHQPHLQNQNLPQHQQHAPPPQRAAVAPPPPPLSSIPRGKKTQQIPQSPTTGGNSSATHATGVTSPGLQNNQGGPRGATPPKSRDKSPSPDVLLQDITKVQLKKTGEETASGDVRQQQVQLSGVRLRPTSARIRLLEKDGIKTAPEEPPQPIEEEEQTPEVPESPQEPLPKPVTPSNVLPNIGLFEKRMEELGGKASKDSKMGDITIDDIDLNDVPGYTPITKSTPIWKRDVIEKKNKEKVEEYLEEKRQERIEAEKWKSVPAWKRKIMMEKEKEKKGASKTNKEEPPTEHFDRPRIREGESAKDYLLRYRAEIKLAEAALAEANKKKTAKQVEEDRKAKVREQQEMERKMDEELQDVPEWKREIMMKRGGAIKNWTDEREDINEQELEEQRLAQEAYEREHGIQEPAAPSPVTTTPVKNTPQSKTTAAASPNQQTKAATASLKLKNASATQQSKSAASNTTPAKTTTEQQQQPKLSTPTQKIKNESKNQSQKAAMQQMAAEGNYQQEHYTSTPTMDSNINQIHPYAQTTSLILHNQTEHMNTRNTQPEIVKCSSPVRTTQPDEDDWESLPSWKREIMMKRGGAIRNWGDEREEVNDEEETIEN